MGRNLMRLLALSARLDDVMMFYIPNQKAVVAATKAATPAMGRTQWKNLFSETRKEIPKGE